MSPLLERGRDRNALPCLERAVQLDSFHREHLSIDKAKRPGIGTDQDFVAGTCRDGTRKPHVENRSLFERQNAFPAIGCHHLDRSVFDALDGDRFTGFPADCRFRKHNFLSRLVVARIAALLHRPAQRIVHRAGRILFRQQAALL